MALRSLVGVNSVRYGAPLDANYSFRTRASFVRTSRRVAGAPALQSPAEACRSQDQGP